MSDVCQSCGEEYGDCKCHRVPSGLWPTNVISVAHINDLNQRLMVVEKHRDDALCYATGEKKRLTETRTFLAILHESYDGHLKTSHEGEHVEDLRAELDRALPPQPSLAWRWWHRSDCPCADYDKRYAVGRPKWCIERGYRECRSEKPEPKPKRTLEGKPCFHKGLSFPAAHCSPPVGYCEEGGFHCPDCPYLDLIHPDDVPPKRYCDTCGGLLTYYRPDVGAVEAICPKCDNPPPLVKKGG